MRIALFALVVAASVGGLLIVRSQRPVWAIGELRRTARSGELKQGVPPAGK